jgi:glycosyltransferase involved in cell wall biosynthesis
MPAYNEADGICEFLEELIDAFADYNLRIIVINDKSTDGTSKVLKEFKDKNDKQEIEIIDCVTNIGHGPATLRGLDLALVHDNDFIIAIDGDGQFIAEQVLAALEFAISGNYDVVEGVRTNRSDPKFRKISTLGTRILVYSVLKSFPKDANTPLRIYKYGALTRILKSAPRNVLTPNLLISGATRVLFDNFYELPVVSRPRRGVSEKGTSWNQKFNFFPSKRFLRFSAVALIQYFKVIRPHLKSLQKTVQ